ncbi:MAG: isoprenyl transferase [Hyphomicrobiaceae bacterium]
MQDIPGRSAQTAARHEIRHVAIIMDGNGRWARRRGLPRTLGHREGVKALRRAVRAAIELSIPFLTIYAFSSENWSRPKAEVDDLMGLIKRFIRRDLAELHGNGVRLRVIGDRNGVSADLLALMDDAMALTRNNTCLDLVVAFNYGARAEITRAAQALAERVAAGTLTPEAITPELLAGELDTAGMPDPDLLIRTSGEIRLSNFLLWQLAYTEFVFLDVLWPDFDRAQLDQAIAIYRARERRFGGIGSVAPVDRHPAAQVGSGADAGASGTVHPVRGQETA